MDVRKLWNEYLLVIFLIVFNKGMCFEEDYEDTPSFGRCPWIRNKLKNGRVKIRSRGRIAKFVCDPGFELVGKRFATCVRGQWNNPIPVCVARGCPRIPAITNGGVKEMYRGAMLVYDCNPGYSLDGVVSIYCDGRRWSTEPPICVAATSEPELKCDFEDPDLCGWSHDPTHEFDWKRNQFYTPSGHVGTGPSYDHTFGVGKAGFYLYLEASAPRKENDKARLFSPVYPFDYSDSCFVFWYHMYGATTGSLNVFFKPESHVFSELSPTWIKSGDQGNQWMRGHMEVPLLNENFQLVIEGVRGNGYVGDSAIDDVELKKTHCDSLGNETDAVATTVAESCRGRCRESNTDSACGCNDNCYVADSCCNDFSTICTAGNETAAESVEEIIPESELGKTPNLITVTGTMSSSVNPVAELATVLSSNSDDIISPPAIAIITPIADMRTSVITDASTISSTSKPTFLTTTTIESNTPNSLTSSKTSQSSTTIIYSPSVPSLETKLKTEKTNSVTTPSTTTLNSITSTTIEARISTTTTQATTSTTTEQTTTSTTTIKPSTMKLPTSTTTVKPTTVQSTTSTTTIKSTTPASTEINITTSIPTIKFATTESDTSSTTDSTAVTKETAHLSPMSTTISSIHIDIDNSSQAVIPDADSFQNVSTTVVSLSESSSITNTPSTRKTYNFRPRTQKTTVSISISTPSSTGSNSAKTNEIASVSSVTHFFNAEVTKAIYTRTSSKQAYEDIRTIFPYVRLTTTKPQSSNKTVSTNLGPTTLSSRFTPRITTKFTSGNQITTTSMKPVTLTTVDSLNHPLKEASTVHKNSRPTVTIIAMSIAVILCVGGGLVYFRKKQKNKRRSKLADDSEMRFLAENEEIEYSDASVLDRILVK